MKLMSLKKVTAVASTASLMLAVSAPFAFAASTFGSICPEGTSGFGGVCNASSTGTLIGKVISLVFVLAIVIALAYLIYGGIRYILSQGEKAKVEAARGMLISALIGLIVVFLSYFLLNIATNLLFGRNANDLLNTATQNGVFGSAGTAVSGAKCHVPALSTDGSDTCTAKFTCKDANGTEVVGPVSGSGLSYATGTCQ